MLHLLQRVWTYAFTTKSDTAREYADEIAEASSKGYLTTLVTPWPDRHRQVAEGVYGRLWKLTPTGLEYLFNNGDLIAPEEAHAYATHCGN